MPVFGLRVVRNRFPGVLHQAGCDGGYPAEVTPPDVIALQTRRSGPTAKSVALA